MLKGRYLIEPMDFSLEEFDAIIKLPDEIISKPEDFLHVCEGKLLATLFYELSTRTTHSLIKALSKYNGNKFILISPKELRIPEYIKKDILEKHHIEFQEVETLEDVIDQLDILYMTSIRREPFASQEEYKINTESFRSKGKN